MQNKIVVFWFRRDLRLYDNKGLSKALLSSKKVVPLFIFDDEILNSLSKNDARVSFIYNSLKEIDDQLKKINSSLLVKKGKPIEVWKQLVKEYSIESVFTNRDYEPYAIARDTQIKEFLIRENIQFKSYKDQVIFEAAEIVKDDQSPYTVFTPYKKKWLQTFKRKEHLGEFKTDSTNFYRFNIDFPLLSSLGFVKSIITVKPYNLSALDNYDIHRDFPSKDKTSYLSPYLRFGLVSIRKIVEHALHTNETFLSELIWREFFMQILYHFPKVVTENFKSKYNAVVWRNNEQEFQKWCNGETGYPLVDAGMRELNETGYMHNRVRMVVAGFLCKHLLIDWRWGEAYFAKHLLDYDLSANNGNWQWAAGTGCDAAPYFRIFNPSEQLKKFDKELQYIHKWIKDYNEFSYPETMVDHAFARKRALETYKKALN